MVATGLSRCIMVAALNSTGDVWDVLNTIPDPEIPVISLVELGVVRSVFFQNEQLIVVITLTYSGCPATGVIQRDIEAALREHGVKNFAVLRDLSPPWTTDWITASGRNKLENYGIAPPQTAGSLKCCPQCKSKNVAMISAFGSTPCKSLWRCDDCLEPFDYFKCI